MRLVFALLLIFGCAHLSFGQVSRDSLIQGLWYLYPNTSFGSVLKFIRSENAGASWEATNPQCTWAFGKRFHLVARSSSFAIFPPADDIENIALYGGKGKWTLIDSEQILEIVTEENGQVEYFEILRLDEEALWIKEK